MGLLSATLSLARYRIEGAMPDPFLETVRDRLKHHTIREIDNDPAEKSVGWTCFEDPFQPDFDSVNLLFGTYLVFALRIDKKQIPAKVLRKHLEMAAAKRLKQTERTRLTKNEKQELRDEVARRLYVRMPATPNVYEVVWDYEGQALWFFSTQKAANEELESIFAKTFKLSIIRMFPFTEADMTSGLTDDQKDQLYKAAPTVFQGEIHA